MEYHNFEAAELASFRKIMMTSVESMCDDHVNTMDSKTHDVRYLDSLVPCAISNLNDEWGWRLQARYKTIAVSNGLVSRLPWETLLFGKGGHISSVPETVVVPESPLVDIQNCREVALKALGVRLAERRIDAGHYQVSCPVLAELGQVVLDGHCLLGYLL